MKKILIVDDETSIRQLLKQILEAKGYCCSLAAHADEARKHLRRERFDLVLCDILMPGEPGLELVKEILVNYPDTAAIMVTALDDPVVAESALQLGVYGYITKPIERNEVIINVANALHRRELEVAHRAYRQDLESMIAERTKLLARLQSILEQLHSPQVARELIKKVDPLGQPGKTREKLEMTIMFADIRGFSRMVSALELEKIIDFLDAFYGAVSKTVYKHGGSIDKFMGDEVMAFFGAPAVLDNSSENGVKAAVELATSFERLKESFSNNSSFFQDLGIGIGINTGEVFVGNVGSRKRYDYTVIGTPVNLARRLCAYANGDEILTTERTLAGLSGVISWEFVETISLKGIPERVKIYRIRPL